MSLLAEALSKTKENEVQWRAYLENSHFALLAGPGSGKTATLTLKIARLLNEQIKKPRGLACITYNNDAATEFERRLKLFGIVPQGSVFLGTVHSFCLVQIVHKFSHIFRSDIPQPIKIAPDQEVAKNTQLVHLKFGVEKKGKWDFNNRFYDYRRSRLNREAPTWNDDPEIRSAINYYESLLRENGYIDLQDLINISYDLITKNEFVRSSIEAKFPWIVIDEYQDLGYALHQIVKVLIEKTDIKFFIVGDPDQSIYGFTGADPKYLLEIAKSNFFKSEKLKINYRCGQKIINASEIVLKPPKPNEYVSSKVGKEEGEIFFLGTQGGVDTQAAIVAERIIPSLFEAGIKPSEIAVLYIDKHDAPEIKKVFNQKIIPFTGEKDLRYSRTPLIRWIEDCAGYVCGIRTQLSATFNDLEKGWVRILRKGGQVLDSDGRLEIRTSFFERIQKCNLPKLSLVEWLKLFTESLSIDSLVAKFDDEGWESAALEELRTACKEGELSGFTLEKWAGVGPSSNVVTLTTLHSSKGRQFDAVIILGLNESRLPSWRAKTESQIRESRRLFFVGLTRARHTIYLLYSTNFRDNFGNPKGVSRFVKELKESTAKN